MRTKCVMRKCSKADGEALQPLQQGRNASPVGWLVFKTSEGRQAVLCGFDSHLNSTTYQLPFLRHPLHYIALSNSVGQKMDRIFPPNTELQFKHPCAVTTIDLEISVYKRASCWSAYASLLVPPPDFIGSRFQIPPTPTPGVPTPIGKARSTKG